MAAPTVSLYVQSTQFAGHSKHQQINDKRSVFLGLHTF